MKVFLNRLFENHSLIYKIILYTFSVAIIVYLFPKGGQFKYQFQKGKIWNYDDFSAPFDFGIQKTEAELKEEKDEIIANKMLFFVQNDSVTKQVVANFNKSFSQTFDSLAQQENTVIALKLKAEKFLKNKYKKGYVAPENSYQVTEEQPISLQKGHDTVVMPYNTLLTPKNKNTSITAFFSSFADSESKNRVVSLLTKVLEYNVTYDETQTEKKLNDKINQIIPTKGLVAKNTTIISKGEIVEGEKFKLLQSISKEYEGKTWTKANYYWLIGAYTFLVALALFMLLFFIKKYRQEIYENASKISFVFINVILAVLVTTLVLQFDVHYLYVIPFVIFPLITKAFFDARLGLFTHVLTILLLGFIVSNSFEFIFIQIIAGIVTILTVSELNKRANLFVSVAKITAVYLLSYFAFSIAQEGNASSIDWYNIGLFMLNGIITISLVIPVIFLYEKIFGLVSDESLREFSDTNSVLLRELNEKAPGTFQHSMQVANLAEAAAKEINANALLVRTGALYHDIGKTLNPIYFTENQATSVNPHNELPPKESAQIIIGHIIQGIELAKKHKLPDRVIDFIRTHHGTSLVYYFYRMEADLNPDYVKESDFQYPGPIPFSKETAILMMCDAAEAASKSLKEPSAIVISDLIDKVIKGQMDKGQFQNAAITFKEIETVKRVIKKKLNSIYHVRIEYPE